MCRLSRCESFLVNAPNILERMAGLSVLAVGAFVRLYFKAWWGAERPGYLQKSDTYLAGCVGVSAGEWADLRGELEAVFDTTSEPGFWVVPGMPEEHAAQTEFIDSQRRKGIQSGISRRRNRELRLNRGSNSGSTVDGTAAEPTPEPTQGSGFLVLESKTKHTPRRVVEITDQHIRDCSREYGLSEDHVRDIASEVSVYVGKNKKPYQNRPLALRDWCSRRQGMPKPTTPKLTREEYMILEAGGTL